MKKKNKIRRIITIAVSMVLGGGIGYLGAMVGGKAASEVPASV